MEITFILALPDFRVHTFYYTHKLPYTIILKFEKCKYINVNIFEYSCGFKVLNYIDG